MKKALFQIETLTCPTCIKQIEATLNRTAGVVSTVVLFNLGKVRIEFEESYINVGQLAIIIQQLGYSIVAAKSS